MKIPIRMNKQPQNILANQQTEDIVWPPSPDNFGELLTPVEVAQ
jgi:hypothetical protein